MAETYPLPVHHIRIKKLKSLLVIVENSIKGGDNYLFRNLYAEEKGKEIDILKDGNLSCAVFCSAILLNLELIKKPHSTVNGLEKDMLESGWYEVEDYKPGAVLIWGKKVSDDSTEHRHVGFCVDNDGAISNDSKSGFPRRHHRTYNDSRKIEKIYWHPELDND